MSQIVEELKSRIGHLSREEKADLVHHLLAELEPEVDEGAEEAWEAEVERRTEEVRTGRAVGKPADQLFSELRKEYP